MVDGVDHNIVHQSISQVHIPVHIHDMTVAYDRKPVLWDVDLAVPEGKLVGIVGPNGAGKSTLIKAVMDLVPKASGWVRIYGQPSAATRQQIGYVPQRESVDWDFPVSAFEVVLMGRYGHVGWIRRPRKADRDAAEEALRKVGREAYRDRQISQLSGGQQQRIFLARALAQDARVYLMDEPFAGVDPISVGDIKLIISQLSARGIGILITDHNVRETLSICDQAYIVNDGIIIAEGDPSEVLTNQHVKEVYLGTDFRM